MEVLLTARKSENQVASSAAKRAWRSPAGARRSRARDELPRWRGEWRRPPRRAPARPGNRPAQPARAVAGRRSARRTVRKEKAGRAARARWVGRVDRQSRSMAPHPWGSSPWDSVVRTGWVKSDRKVAPWQGGCQLIASPVIFAAAAVTTSPRRRRRCRCSGRGTSPPRRGRLAASAESLRGQWHHGVRDRLPRLRCGAAGDQAR